MKHLLAAALPAVMVAGGLAAAGHGWPGGETGRAAGAQRGSGDVVRIDDARLKFEINATDGDGGIQVFLDAEQWRVMTIRDPSGRKIFSTRTRGIMAEQGGTELFMESAEPTFDDLPLADLLERWPAGRYAFRGRGLDGERYVGAARLTHDLPEGPELVSPLEGAGPQDRSDTVLRWRRVPPPNGSPIIGYQVLVVEPDTGLRALPNVALDVMMPPTAHRLRVPPGFLQPGTEYEWEVLAVERGGNQTLSSSSFVTAR
jgi:hypothetical protein